MDLVDCYLQSNEYSDLDGLMEKKLDLNSEGNPQWKKHMVHGKQRELHEMKSRFLFRETESFVCKSVRRNKSSGETCPMTPRSYKDK